MPWVHCCPWHPDTFVGFACIPFPSPLFSPSITHNLVPLDWAHHAPPLALISLLSLGIILIFHGVGPFRGSGDKTSVKKLLV